MSNPDEVTGQVLSQAVTDLCNQVPVDRDFGPDSRKPYNDIHDGQPSLVDEWFKKLGDAYARFWVCLSRFERV